MTSDHSKMVISTSEGYLMAIHDLDLRTLGEDLSEFQSDLYRLMQKVSNGCGGYPNFGFKTFRAQFHSKVLSRSFVSKC